MIRIIATLIMFYSLIGHAEKLETKNGLDLSTTWKKTNIDPIMDGKGRVMFVYGESLPQVVCAPLALCDIGLEPGEIIGAVNVGDTARWVITPARVGAGKSLEEHLVVKPMQTGLRTTLFIATDRRAYIIELLSMAEEYMSKVGFVYHDKQAGNIQLLAAPTTTHAPQLDPQKKEPSLISVKRKTGHDVLASKLNFNYRIWGSKVSWRPIRVYDDGVKTFIDLDPRKVGARELPTLLVTDTNKRGSMINYRYIDGRFIVDGLFNHAALVIGKGGRQKKVNVARTNNTDHQQTTVAQ